MAFQNSPNFEAQDFSAKPSVRYWVGRHSRLALIMLSVFIILDLLLAAYILISKPTGSPGGLEGCITNASGEPVSATVWVGETSRQTYEDGCFFFPTLEPGNQHLIIQTNKDQMIEQMVEIISGEAVDLGEILIST